MAVSHAVASQARRYYGIRVDRVIENGVDTDLFRPRDRIEARRRLGLPGEGRMALFVGRVEPRKGPLIAAAAARRAGALLLVASAQRIAGALNLGLLAPTQLTWAYAAADCILLPTRYEGCAYVALEALACARPLITTQTGWTSDLAERLPEYAPLLTRPSVEAVADALERVDRIASPDLLRRARSLVVEHNSLQRWTAQWRVLCTEVAATVQVPRSGNRVLTR